MRRALLGRVGVPLLRELVHLVLRGCDPALQSQLIRLISPISDKLQLPALVHHVLALHFFEFNDLFKLGRNRWIFFDKVKIDFDSGRARNRQAELVKDAAVA